MAKAVKEFLDREDIPDAAKRKSVTKIPRGFTRYRAGRRLNGSIRSIVTTVLDSRSRNNWNYLNS